MAINNRKLLLLCNPGIPGLNHVACVPDVLKRYKEYFKSAVGGAWIDGDYGEIIEEPQGMGDQQEINWLTDRLGDINRNADYAMIVFVGHGDAYLGQDRIRLSQGGIVSVNDFLPLPGEENHRRRTVVVDACRSISGTTQQQMVLEQRQYSGLGQLDRQSCRDYYNQTIEACEPHTELIQSTQYGAYANVNQAGTGTAFSDAFFDVLNANVAQWNRQALLHGQNVKSCVDLLPLIQIGMQAYNQVPQYRRSGNGIGVFPIYAVRRAVPIVL